MTLHLLSGPALLLLLVSPAWFAAPTRLSGEGIIGSKHDFSGAPWNTTGEACSPCHTPHTASQSGEAVVPLWSHDLSTSTYELYSSTSLKATPDQPRGVSRLCLGCHDGTVALDSFAGRTGTRMVTGNARIGTDISDTHPISIDWTHKGVRNCRDCHFVHGQMMASPVPFYDGRVECATCHDPHDITPRNPQGGYMLRLSMAKSTLCLLCHTK